ncbi:YitT family protein [Oscillospiraceae bacterium NSJ-64]|uniref:YitT family protein n=1 Tax=Youxingia wuxianensis TaxID=2763678 RepID=A0A926EIR8_9FIRM|nr:YitT family protein [Youxingia wuxianensis]
MCFSIGGITDVAVVAANFLPVPASTVNFVLNAVLILLGFLLLGKGLGIMTAYSSMLSSILFSLLELIYPMSRPLTDQPMLELAFGIALPAFGTAILFNMGASNGGTEIVAMILQKYTNIDNGKALFLCDLLVTLSAFFVFNFTTGLFSLLGLLIKSLMVDSVIESINLCKYFNVVCGEPKIICDFIVDKLHRGATVASAKGAFTNGEKYIIFTVVNRPQAVALRQFIKRAEPSAFIMITDTSEIIGKGFHRG